jgi:hypothetical protein
MNGTGFLKNTIPGQSKKKILFPFIQQKIPFDDWTGSVVKEISRLSH